MNREKNIIYGFLIWTVVALFTTTQLFLKVHQSEGDATWISFLKIQLLVWWLWGGLTPIIFQLARRFRLDKQALFRSMLIHLPVSVIMVCTYLGIYSLIWNIDAGTVDWDHLLGIWAALFLNLFHWHFFIYMAIVGIVHARLYYMEIHAEQVKNAMLQKNLIESRLSFLKMQLQPHFLFNALNSIVSAIHRGKPDTAADMTTGLSDLLRLSLRESEKQMVTLEEEMEYVKSYLKIEQYRFKEMQITYHVRKEALSLQVPSFILQPLTENAIKHGISKKTAARKLTIEVLVEQGVMTMKVSNDGPEPTNISEGVGIRNIKNRLANLYGEAAQLTFSYVDGQFVAEIRLPIKA